MKKNILFIMSDDHAAHAISCYGSRINQTPNIDRIAKMGIRFDNCHCTNALCAPSRAVIITGKHSHINGVTTLETPIDSRQPMVSKLLQEKGYQTAIIGKWHLGLGENHNPTGFDYWNIFPGQGDYFDPVMYENGNKVKYNGYATNVVTELTINWLDQREKDKPFFVMCHHKAPHRPCHPDKKYETLFDDIDLKIPETFYDSYEGRSDAVKFNEMKIEELTSNDTKGEPPLGLSAESGKEWKYQRCFKDYLRCVASVDDSVGELLDYLEDNNLLEDTIVIYTSDQGFFLGDHGWFDKRYMLEESMKMPFVICGKGFISENIVVDEIISNLDFAPTFLDYAKIDIPEDMQGKSFKRLLEGDIDNWDNTVYYRYWVSKGEHGVSPHYGIRTKEYKLICYLDAARNYSGKITPGQENSTWPQWELFDLKNDIEERENLYNNPQYATIVKELTKELYDLKKHYKDFD